MSNNFYKTENAKINMAIPASMRRMTAEQIIDAVRKFEFSPDRKRPAKPGIGCRMIEATAEAVFDPKNWKNPICANWTVDAEGRNAREWVKAAIMWYHAAKPLESYIGVYSQGYAAW